MRKSTTLNTTFAIDFHYIDYVWHTHSYCTTLWFFKKVCQRGVHSTHGFGCAQLLLVTWHPHSCRSTSTAASSLGFFVFFASGDWRQMLTAVFRCPSSSTLSVQATSLRRTYAPGFPSVAESSLDFFRFSRLRWLTTVAHSSFPLFIVLYVVGPGHITSENGRTRVPLCRRVVQHTRSDAARNAAQRTELAADQLSRFHHQKPVASKFAGYKPNGLSCVGCNVGSLPQA